MFDTIDIDILLKILNEEIGLTGMALQWCRSFLTGRKQRVKVNGKYSSSLDVEFGVPQGSVLGPKFFNIYVRSQPEVFKSCGFKSTAFADDANGMKTFSITFQYNILKNEVANCINTVANWMHIHCLKINAEKTEINLFYPKSLQDQVKIGGTLIGDDCVRYSRHVKNVGVWLDNHLKFDCHVNKIVAHSYKLLKDIGRIRNVLSQRHTEILVHAVVSSRLDNCNSLFFNMGKGNMFKLQKVQNAAARLVVRKGKRCSITNVLRELHWLKVEARVMFKILLLVYKYVTGQCPRNFHLKYKSHNCRDGDFLLLETCHAKTKHGKRTFTYVGPRLWNALPPEVRKEKSIDVYKKCVKTILFEGWEKFKQTAFKYDS